MNRLILLILLAAIGLPMFASAATIYRCAGAGGATVFSQVPCGKDASQMDANGAAKPPSTPAADASGDKAALAGINGRCDAQSRQILDGYSARFAEANATIADLHKQLMTPGTNAAKDPAVQKQINAVEAHKTELLGSQDSELSALRNQCQMDKNVELKRQSNRDAARAMAKR